MITNRHKTRVLNEILEDWCKESHILYGDNRTPVEQATFEETLLMEGMHYKGIDIEKISVGARKIEISITIRYDEAITGPD
jgi:hypothetical protein